MERDFFAYLPSETIIDILSRLSVRSIALSKCVCKSWLDLLDSDDFVNSHFSKSSASAAALAVSIPATRRTHWWCKVFELEDEVDDLDSQNPITKFDIPRKAKLEGSANDLIFLISYELSFGALYLCNPITPEFIGLPLHEDFAGESELGRITYGFGASKVTRKYKAVRIDSKSDDCHVYTLGTGRWRRVEAAATGGATTLYHGASVSGNLYWKVQSKSNMGTWVSCFDLETECFSTISCPPVRSLYFDLVSLRECLFAVDDPIDDEIVLWLLNECGVEKSWRKEYVIEQHPDYHESGFFCVQPIKVFENGDILMLCDEVTFFCYSIKTKTYREIPSFGAPKRGRRLTLLFTTSFRSLKRSFPMENVISF